MVEAVLDKPSGHSRIAETVPGRTAAPAVLSDSAQPMAAVFHRDTN